MITTITEDYNPRLWYVFHAANNLKDYFWDKLTEFHAYSSLSQSQSTGLSYNQKSALRSVRDKLSQVVAYPKLPSPYQTHGYNTDGYGIFETILKNALNEVAIAKLYFSDEEDSAELYYSLELEEIKKKITSIIEA